jgi:hypothetical protein
MSYAPIYAVSQADTLPPYTATLTYNNAPVNLTTATSVTFIMANYFSGVVATGTATIVSASTGQVSYSWGSSDLATPGVYSIQWEVTFPTGNATYPAHGYNYLTVLNNLAIGYPNVSPVFNTIHSSTAAPTSAQGVNGDYWYNTSNTYFYGPKAAGVWPAGFPLYASGGVQLAGDLGGTVSIPEVISTHLTSALPINQGGTGQNTAPTAGQELVATSGTATQWVTRDFNVQAFGALGNGTTDDTAAIQSAINAVGAGGGRVYFPPTATGYLLNSTALTVTVTNTILAGGGAENTFLIIGSSFTGAEAIDITAYNCQVQDLSIHGASGTTTSNPVANGIEVSGARRAKINRVEFNNINGWAIEVAATNASSTSNCLGTQIAQVFGQSCAGGIHFLGNTTQGFAMNCQATDIQFYSTGVTTGASANLDSMRVEDSWDVLLENCILWTSLGTGSSLHIKGNTAASFNANMDLLGPTTGPCVLIENSTNGSPQNVQLQGGVIQQGAPGLSITGAAYQVHISTTRIINNQTHGIQIGGTGASIFIVDCFFNTNGAGASGTNYDINWSGTSIGKVIGAGLNSNIVTTGSAGVQTSINIASAQAVMFDQLTFGGSGSSSATWFTNTPAGVLESGSGNFNFVTTATFGNGTRSLVAQPSSITNTAVAGNVSGTQANDNWRILGNGTFQLGPGGATGRDTVFGRAAAGVGYATNSLLVGSATDLGDNGSGEIKLANATTVPTTNPTAGNLLYASGGELFSRDSSGNVYPLTLLSAAGGGTTVTGVTAVTAIASGVTVPANTLAAGQVYRFKAWGAVTTTVDTQTVQIGLYWGGVAGTSLLNWGLQTPNASATVSGAAWMAEWEVVVLSTTSLAVSGWDGLNYYFSSLTENNEAITSTSSEQFVVGVTPSATALSITCAGFYCQRVR